jgi:hypothetical protein
VNGITDWSLNLEAACEGTIIIRGMSVAVAARRLPPAEAAPVLRDAIAGAPKFVRSMTSNHFIAGLESPLEAWEEDAATHPVFILTEVEQDVSRQPR